MNKYNQLLKDLTDYTDGKEDFYAIYLLELRMIFIKKYRLVANFHKELEYVPYNEKELLKSIADDINDFSLYPEKRYQNKDYNAYLDFINNVIKIYLS